MTEYVRSYYRRYGNYKSDSAERSSPFGDDEAHHHHGQQEEHQPQDGRHQSAPTAPSFRGFYLLHESFCLRQVQSEVRSAHRDLKQQTQKFSPEESSVDLLRRQHGALNVRYAGTDRRPIPRPSMRRVSSCVLRAHLSALTAKSIGAMVQRTHVTTPTCPRTTGLGQRSPKRLIHKDNLCCQIPT